MQSPESPSPTDFMAQAIALARAHQGQASPNPTVAALVVKGGKVIAQGVTEPAGGRHAEVVALEQAGEQARGGVLYTTLEPCGPYPWEGKRHPPCVQVILRAGIRSVHIATLDPHPQVNGHAVRSLQAAGVEVVVGEHQEEAQELVEAHAKWHRTGLPFLTLKWAMSLDGKIATTTGDARWISSPPALEVAHRLRFVSDAVMVGIGTVLADDPALSARRPDGTLFPRQPLRVIVDSSARTPPSARCLTAPGGKTLIAVGRAPQERLRALEAAGVEVVRVPAPDGRVDLPALCRLLGQRAVTSLLVEGGGNLNAALLAYGLVDKVVACIAPRLIGGQSAPTPVEGAGIPRIADALTLERVRVERVGPDLLVVGYLPKR
ncbi:MAG: bifunctional diaminohydroxyphosphoribosylaminopyrimidine deaminase/5-amino-6-(5-phosphoribosylamino)uracil reductase RibD [Dehalococcoidia bacterium]|nr:bifunctional diaminohydroxyphosphoribosylaminopyrimidine deaminase/5-amino-6-(5-phosphoribosylamino)uracil reductase RibD [Dehalococcoidia bacterium]MDW8119576.1 bifunctional diaminohydroxyphosphoribosylaminopyrimidine deaminase/5-amino-6-(5-phosphoribosylamino)uracil reductase RibD [Chloroflexota bacterium]